MQRYKQPSFDVHPDGEWVLYTDHIDAMKRIAGAPVAQGLTDERELDLYDEIECDLNYLFGRASKEGHEAGQKLAAQIREKMQRARAASPAALTRDAVANLAKGFMLGANFDSFMRGIDDLLGASPLTDEQIIAIYQDHYTDEPGDAEPTHILPFARALLDAKAKE